jgi:hypothetical protein
MMRHFGATSDNEALEKNARGMGAMGLGLVGALAGAVAATRIKPSWVWPAAAAGFLLPVLVLSPKKDKAA